LGKNFFSVVWGKIFGYKLSERARERKIYYDTYKAFAEAFTSTTIMLKKDTFAVDDFFVSFREDFDRQENAMIRLTDKMRKKEKLIRFFGEWGNYKHWRNQCETYEICKTTIGLKSQRKELLAVIENLLAIAKKY
jgi:hypothetical protein